MGLAPPPHYGGFWALFTIRRISPSPSGRGVGVRAVIHWKTETPLHKPYRSPPPRPSPAAGFALQGRGIFGAADTHAEEAGNACVPAAHTLRAGLWLADGFSPPSQNRRIIRMVRRGAPYGGFLGVGCVGAKAMVARAQAMRRRVFLLPHRFVRARPGWRRLRLRAFVGCGRGV